MPGRSGWLVGGAAALLGAAAYGAYRRLRRQPAPEPDLQFRDTRAEELRRKLDESRSLIDEPGEFESAETPVDRAEAPASDLDERRRRVHERGRAAADEMRGDAG